MASFQGLWDEPVSASASTETYVVPDNASGTIDIRFTAGTSVSFCCLLSSFEVACEWAKDKIENQHYVNLLRNSLFKNNKTINRNKIQNKSKRRNVKLFTKRNIFNRQHKG